MKLNLTNYLEKSEFNIMSNILNNYRVQGQY